MSSYSNWVCDECWSDIDRFPNHQISTYGRVRNKHNGHILKSFADRYGYERVSIGNTDNVYIHKLVCETFHGDIPFNKAQINHRDCDRSYNEVSNLEWCTASENIKWAIDHGSLDYSKGLNKAIEVNQKPVVIIELNKKFNSVKNCADYLNVAATNVSSCLKGKKKTVKGFHVEYSK